VTAPVRQPGQNGLDGLRRRFDALPLVAKILVVAVCTLPGFIVGLLIAPYMIISGNRTFWGTWSASWGWESPVSWLTTIRERLSTRSFCYP